MLEVSVQAQVRAYAESLGPRGQRWLSALPELAAQLSREWGLTPFEALTGGSRSYVCRVQTVSGERAVLKVALPELILESQFETLLAACGKGYVQVLAHDVERGALLLESLGPSAEAQLGRVPELLPVLAQTLEAAWQVPHTQPAPGETEHKAAGLTQLILDCVELVGPAQEAVISQALQYARERLRARDPRRQVLVHGDAHAGNLLQVEQARPGAESGYVFVDPEGFVCEAEYDLGVALRDWNEQLLASDDPGAELWSWCEQLAQATRSDPEAIWQWAYLERVTTGLYLARHGLAELGAPFLEVAGILLRLR